MNILDEITEKRRKSITDVVKKYTKVHSKPKIASLFYDSIVNDSSDSIISEVKFASPSMGDIKEKIPVKTIISTFKIDYIMSSTSV